MSDDISQEKLDELERTMQSLQSTDKRNAAEHAYALALLYANLRWGSVLARKFAATCARLLADQSCQRVQRNREIMGVTIPDDLSAAIRERFNNLAVAA